MGLLNAPVEKLPKSQKRKERLIIKCYKACFIIEYVVMPKSALRNYQQRLYYFYWSEEVIEKDDIETANFSSLVSCSI